MIFTRLELENFGLFRGHHSLELSPRRPASGEYRNIVLFGGKNGAGKTTILEAVRLCLYGQRSRGTRVRRTDYEQFLAHRVHRSRDPELTPDGASVTLEFEHVHAGDTSAYRVERTWRVTGASVDEDLTVHKDGEKLDQFDQDHWENFVAELVPPGVSQLFFFDGEKIQALAEEEGEDSELANSIKALLGLDLGERLVSDLSVYIRRHEDAEGTKPDTLKSLEDLAESEDAARDELVRLKQDRAQCESRIRETEKRIRQVEDRISHEGGSFARHREELIAGRARIEEELRTLEASVRELAAGLLPFALIPGQMKQLKGELRRDETVRAERFVADLLTQRSDTLRKHLESVLADGRSKSAPAVKELEEAVWLGLMGDSSRDELPKPTHPVSEEQSHHLLVAIDAAMKEIPVRVKKLDRELDLAARELNEIETALQKAPDDETLRPLLNELAALHSELSAAEEDRNNLDSAVDELIDRIETIRKKIERTEARIADSDDASDRVRLAAKVQRVVATFAEEATAYKVEQLRNHFRQRFGALSRKDDVIDDVQIDPDTFEVTLFDEAGRGIAKSELSAGEKQVYAIAMLWALAITSGRPLPFLIDTPLGRLDSDHRSNIVNDYFPAAAHQVVIFSTDTEIDREFFHDLEDHIARAYHLSYDGSENVTEVEPGYFWESDHDEPALESPAA